MQTRGFYLDTRLHFIIIQPHQAQLIGPLHWNCHQPACTSSDTWIIACLSPRSVLVVSLLTNKKMKEKIENNTRLEWWWWSVVSPTATPPTCTLFYSSSSFVFFFMSWLSTQFTFNHVNLLFIKLTRYPFHHVTQRVSPNSLYRSPSNVHSSSPSHENTAQTPREETWKKFPFNNAYRMILWINSCVIFLILWFSSSNAQIHFLNHLHTSFTPATMGFIVMIPTFTFAPLVCRSPQFIQSLAVCRFIKFFKPLLRLMMLFSVRSQMIWNT